jgi:hypothetical protein
LGGSSGFLKTLTQNPPRMGILFLDQYPQKIN